jgi:hypothetical protein
MRRLERLVDVRHVGGERDEVAGVEVDRADA